MKRSKNIYLIYGFIVFFFAVYLCNLGLAQEKNSKKITFEQAYLDAKPYILKPATRIPTSRTPIRGWFDDEHYLLSERDEKTKSTKLYKVSAKTGKRTLFIDYDQIQKIFPKELKANQHAGFTQDYSGLLYSFENDLYYTR